MADVAIIDLFSRVRIECPGCPEDVMELTMLDVIRDFCQQSRAWIHEVEWESILKGVSDYDIELPNKQCQPIAIEHMEVEGEPCEFKTTAWLDDNIPNWRHRESDDFSIFTHITPKVITFPCIPLTGVNCTCKRGGLYYRVSLKPTTDATGVPQALADEYIEVWSDGTKARLKAVPEKRWTDVTRAAQLEKAYRIGRADARIRANRSYGNSVDVWTGPFFA